MDHKMVLDTLHTLPHPTRSSITTFGTSLGAGNAPSQGRPATQRRQRILVAIASYLFGKATNSSDDNSHCNAGWPD
jgi:hypothetical protein